VKSKESAENMIRFRKHEKIYSGIDQIQRKTADNTLTPGCLVLDGGCAEKIPISWAKCSGEEKLVVVRTRELSFRRKPGAPRIAERMYRRYPAFVRSLQNANEEFNRTVDALEQDAAAGKIFLIAPSEPVTVNRFDGDMEKLGSLYWLGYRDMSRQIEDLIAYLQA
jgi:predicted patatin/cPLA2 family phospholipase